MAKRMPPRTVLEVCVQRLGVHKGAFAAAKVAQWAMTAADLGRMPTTVEYADYWALTERSGWYHRRDIHAALGDDWQEVVLAIAANMPRERSPRAIGRLPLPA